MAYVDRDSSGIIAAYHVMQHPGQEWMSDNNHELQEFYSLHAAYIAPIATKGCLKTEEEIRAFVISMGIDPDSEAYKEMQKWKPS